MLEPDEVAAMVRLQALGWGSKRIAREFGCSRGTVRRYLEAGGWSPFRKPRRARRAGRARGLAGASGSAGTAATPTSFARSSSASTGSRSPAHGGAGGAALRRSCMAEARATVRFETPPGQQLQIDFGERPVVDRRARGAGASCSWRRSATRVGCTSPRFRHERQRLGSTGWRRVPARSAACPRRCCSTTPARWSSTTTPRPARCVFNDRLHAFARYWGFRPRACAPYRARTKGKDERGVGYVKRNAIAGRALRELGGVRGASRALDAGGRRPARPRHDRRAADRALRRDEAAALRPLGGRPPFGQLRELVREVRPDCAVDLDTNSYSVPWRLIGETVAVDGRRPARCVVRHAGARSRRHAARRGRRQRVIDRAHLAGVVGRTRLRDASASGARRRHRAAELLRPLAEYEAVVGGGW